MSCNRTAGTPGAYSFNSSTGATQLGRDVPDPTPKPPDLGPEWENGRSDSGEEGGCLTLGVGPDGRRTGPEGPPP